MRAKEAGERTNEQACKVRRGEMKLKQLPLLGAAANWHRAYSQ